ncbi:MAG: response regulator transcription factor [Ruminococcaceae bacterium]|nr:response regulator transcription factor [Oscillospiraceae bacterium]
MKRILIVDDEPHIRHLVAKYAKFEGFDVSEAENGMEALSLCRDNDYDIIIMDIMMPELDGFSASREIRRSKDVPIILLSARGEEYDRINGFELGADDYVVKPFSPKELMLRVNAILKRSSTGALPPSASEVFQSGGLVIDIKARTVTVDGERITMTPKEYDLIFYMARNAGIALSREKLICDVWGFDFYGDDRTLDTHVKLLRKSLGAYGNHIVTLRGVGYRFETKI